MGKLFRVLIAAALAVLAAKYLRSRQQEQDEPQWPEWTPQPTEPPATSEPVAATPETPDEPEPPAPIETPAAPAATETGDTAASWVEPDPEGDCPISHPVKLKASSGIFHEPGMLNYERTNADRCYVSAAAAEADGHRAAKR